MVVMVRVKMSSSGMDLERMCLVLGATMPTLVGWLLVSALVQLKLWVAVVMVMMKMKMASLGMDLHGLCLVLGATVST